jgi:hypothetical protein
MADIKNYTLYLGCGRAPGALEYVEVQRGRRVAG